jgi:hypothetical protein
MTKRMVVLSCVLLMLGCASRAFRQRMDSYVGRATIEDAVSMFGPPAYEQQLPSGTLLAWESHQLKSYTAPPSQVPPIGPGPSTSTREPRQLLMLTFGPDGRLASWRYVSR